MGRDIHVRVALYNEETNKYEELKLFRKRNKYEKYKYDEKGNKIEITNPLIQASIYNGRNSEMFDGMKDGDETDGYNEFPWTYIKMNSLEDELKEDIEKKMNITGYFDFYEITLADMALYLEENPTVTDYDSDIWDDWKAGDSRPQKTNPIKHLYQEICDYAKIADWLSWESVPLSAYKVIFYFDW